MTPESLQNTQTYEIVCLEHQDTYLYAEMIQIVESRHRCWVRPLLLHVTGGVSSSQAADASVVHDLRDGSDLLWPLSCFRTAMDTEILPFLAQLQTEKPHPSADPAIISEQARLARQALRQFTQQVWHAYPEVFSVK